MSKPRHGPPKVQITAYVREDLKTRLAARAVAEKKPERAVLEEALDQHLREPPPPEENSP